MRLEAMNTIESQILILSPLLTPEKLSRIDQVLENRTRSLSVVIENLYQPHNASAVLRSCDAFGVQNVHVIETRNTFRASRGVSLGCEKWLTIERYRGKLRKQGITTCVDKLKKSGYRLVATSPYKPNCTLETVPIDRPIALLFGAEKDGLSPELLAAADDRLAIPMFGFSESFNVSVSAALCLQGILSRIRQSENTQWRLSREDQAVLKLEWLRRTIRGADSVLRHVGHGSKVK